MEPTTQPSEDYQEIAEKVRSGEYFREARTMYDLAVHDPMAERYMYVLITVLSSVIFLAALIAVRALYPLQPSVPFIVSTNNIMEDLPHISSLVEHKGEDPSEALLRFLVKNYVTFREEYDIEKFNRDTNGVKTQSSPAVFKEFEQLVDPRNPESPITLYQRHSKRHIDIESVKRLVDGDFGIEVIYTANVESKTESKKSRWQANIAFNYSGIALDEKTGRVKPISFIVTQYRTKRVQDIK